MGDSDEKPIEISDVLEEGKSPYVYIHDKKYGWIPAEIITKHYDEDAAADALPHALTVRTVKPKNWDDATSFEESEAYPFAENTSVRVDLTGLAKKKKKMPVQNVDDAGDVIHKADMADLGFLHEAAILYSLKERNYRQKPYSRVNSILVAMNPFRWIDGMYTPEKLKEYAEHIIWDPDHEAESNAEEKKEERANPRESRLLLEPHPLEISCMAYRDLAATGKDQSVLISGESGSGKTEMTKILMRHLASFRQLAEERKESEVSASPSDVADRVLQSNFFILEAFGNAQTVRNENSSRFSKFVQMQFYVKEHDRTDAPMLVGSNCQTYVLEKSRTIKRDVRERNFHIFYQLLEADNEFKREIWEGLDNTDCTSFKIVGSTGKEAVTQKPDKENFEATLQALITIGLSEEQRHTLWRALCIVLQMGNVSFGVDPDDGDRTHVLNRDELDKLAEIMGIPSQEVREALTSRTVQVGMETYHKPLNASEAAYSRDTLAKGIFSSIFEHIVETLNTATQAETRNDGTFPVPGMRLASVNILDIFGFEANEKCYFEQLCINYANEKIQLKYTQDNFDKVHTEFVSEGIEIGNLTVIHQPEVLELLEGRVGLINILNEECIRPTATYKSFVSKLKLINGKCKCLLRKRTARSHEFGIKHFAADLTYDARNFITVNKDTVAGDLVKCILHCKNDIVSSQGKKMLSGGGEEDRSNQRQRGWLVTATVLGKFQRQLKTLMRNIEYTNVRYIRCIKPNKEMHPGRTDHKETLRQLTCAGLVEALTVSRHYFQHRLSNLFAIQQFQCLLDREFLQKAAMTDRQAYAERMFSALLVNYVVQDTSTDNRAFAVGITKVYFRKGSLEHLEARRQIVVTTAAVKIQRWMRTWLARWHFLKLVRGMNKLQANVRCRKERRRFLHLRQASIELQTSFRVKIAQSQLKKLKVDEAATKIQRWYRCRGSKWNFLQELTAAKKIQKFLRRRLKRDRFSSMMAVVVEDARKDAQIKHLLESLKASHKATPEDFVQLQGLLQESYTMLHYAREQMFKLRGNVSNLKLDKGVLFEDNVKLKERYSYMKETNNAMKLNITKLNDTNSELLDNISRQRAIINDKSKELRSKSKEVKTLKDHFESTKTKMEEDHRSEMAKVNKETASLVVQHTLALAEKEEGHKILVKKLQNEIHMQQQELEKEEESYNVSFAAMMSALDRRPGQLRSPTASISSMDSQMMSSPLSQMMSSPNSQMTSFPFEDVDGPSLFLELPESDDMQHDTGQSRGLVQPKEPLCFNFGLNLLNFFRKG